MTDEEAILFKQVDPIQLLKLEGVWVLEIRHLDSKWLAKGLTIAAAAAARRGVTDKSWFGESDGGEKRLHAAGFVKSELKCMPS